MAQLMVNLPDEVKKAWKVQCISRGKSMAEVVLELILRDLSLDTLVMGEIKSCTCQVCGFVWEPKRGEPRACLRCKSYRWNDPRVSRELKTLTDEESTDKEHRREVREQRKAEALAIKTQKAINVRFWAALRGLQVFWDKDIHAELGTTREILGQYISKPPTKKPTLAAVEHMEKTVARLSGKPITYAPSSVFFDRGSMATLIYDLYHLAGKSTDKMAAMLMCDESEAAEYIIGETQFTTEQAKEILIILAVYPELAKACEHVQSVLDFQP